MQYQAPELEVYNTGTEFLLDATDRMGVYGWDNTTGEVNGGDFGHLVVGQEYCV